MNKTPWIFAVVAFSAGACSKSSNDGTTVPAATEPAAPGSARAEPTSPAPADVPGSAEPSSGGVKGDVVALGADDKTKVLPGNKKEIASGAGYALVLSSPEKVPNGSEGVATLEIVPQKGWHLNREFPAKLTVTAPADVKLAKPEQKLEDASAWSETSGTFTMKFTPSAAGQKSLSANLRFAVCTESTCDPKKEAFSWAVAVE